MAHQINTFIIVFSIDAIVITFEVVIVYVSDDYLYMFAERSTSISRNHLTRLLHVLIIEKQNKSGLMPDHDKFCVVKNTNSSTLEQTKVNYNVEHSRQ